MTPQAAKRKGSEFEQRVSDYLRWALNDDRIERRHLTGSNDRGDITGIHLDGKRVVIECKNTAQLNLPKHLQETDAERLNDDAAVGVLIQKRRGMSMDHMGSQYAVMTLETFALILNHLQPLGPEEA